MDSLSALGTSSTRGYASLDASLSQNNDGLLLTTLLGESDAADVSVEIDDLYKSLSISAQRIIGKINELLKSKLPNGVESLKPEDVTPEATAERIVSSVTGLFDRYLKSQGPDVDPETALANFLAAARKGVEQGFGDAYSTLEDLGAFEFEGVKDGVLQTKDLIEQKLQAFETETRKKLGLDSDDAITDKTAEVVKDGITGSTGAKIAGLDVTA